ncbi:F0F1 ATP synthase subunit epsilon [Georgenia subflava]|uniref:F0F1 ATP synthase subunit epsilon n=1 Tax=Georgenia subflava TaxID=1622177 RepID=A0A6N7EL14_9MICO|nr:F0F1 ATP synthase subunit epsilon [Georgenia subflava]MPV38131.1 F0F1 ATP synthase subunit epsilon [Georgenia subflava]
MAMTVDVVSTTAQLWRGDATSVVVPAANGDLGIMTGHQPLLAVLRPGTVRVTPESGSVVELDVAEGFVSVDEDAVTIVVDSAGTRRPGSN